MELPPIDEMSEKEKKRRARIVQKRINQHDPGPKVKGVNWNPDRSRHKPQKALIVEVWDSLPPRYRGGIVGGIIGLIALVPCALLLPGAYKLLGLPVFFVCILMVGVIWVVVEDIGDV